MPMMLVMESKTTTQSCRTPIYFADLVTRPGMKLIEAIQKANEYQKAMADAGLSIEGMEEQLRAGLANSDFADEIEDMDEWISDDALIAAVGEQAVRKGGLKGMDNLTEKLAQLNAQNAGAGQEAAPENAPSEASQGEPAADGGDGVVGGAGGEPVAQQQDLLAA